VTVGVLGPLGGICMLILGGAARALGDGRKALWTQGPPTEQSGSPLPRT
jgi:hypothetical protein